MFVPISFRGTLTSSGDRVRNSHLVSCSVSDDCRTIGTPTLGSNGRTLRNGRTREGRLEQDKTDRFSSWILLLIPMDRRSWVLPFVEPSRPTHKI